MLHKLNGYQRMRKVWYSYLKDINNFSLVVFYKETTEKPLASSTKDSYKQTLIRGLSFCATTEIKT